MLGASRYSEWGLQVLARRIARILLALGCRPAVAAVLGSALVACAEPKAQPSSSPPSQSASAAREQGENSEFAPLTASPRAMAEALVANDERTLSNACGEADAALLEVASQLALQQSERGAELDSDTLTYALRRAGAPYVRPRAWLFDGTSGEVETAKAHMQRWLGSFSDGRTRRCGVVLRRNDASKISVAVVAVEVLADLDPLPTRARIGQWIEVRATLRVPADEAKLVVLGPRGAPRPVPTSLAFGRVLARFNADARGAWLVQLLGSVDGGPRPLLEALVFAGTEPPRTAAISQAPGEDAPGATSEARAALYAMVNAARTSEHAPPLARDARLERLATEHAEAMRRARKTAHDSGDGDVNQRLERAGLELAAGENVAHAGNAALAHRTLWASPSHRGNLLSRGFDLVGIGVAPDVDGTLWVCQIFAPSR